MAENWRCYKDRLGEQEPAENRGEIGGKVYVTGAVAGGFGG
jgi:hypothetical protein